MKDVTLTEKTPYPRSPPFSVVGLRQMNGQFRLLHPDMGISLKALRTYSSLWLLFQLHPSLASPLSNHVSFSHQCPNVLTVDLDGTTQFLLYREIPNSESTFQNPIFKTNFFYISVLKIQKCVTVTPLKLLWPN